MGCYVNPTDGRTKEQWLRDHGKEITREAMLRDYDAFLAEGKMPVVLVNNGIFTAAAVAYDKREATDFANPNDSRPRNYYVVPIAYITAPESGTGLVRE